MKKYFATNTYKNDMLDAHPWGGVVFLSVSLRACPAGLEVTGPARCVSPNVQRTSPKLETGPKSPVTEGNDMRLAMPWQDLRRAPPGRGDVVYS